MDSLPLEIPEQLRDWRFILVKPRSKEAFETNWPSTANYTYDDPMLLKHLQAGGNYGVIAGVHHAILETDDPELEKLVEQELPKTFTVQSPGHNSRHFYFDYVGEPKTIPILDRTRPREQQNIGHVKIGNAYVLGSGSIHPNGKRYEVRDKLDISKISEADIQRVLAPFIAKKSKTAEIAEGRRQRSDVDFDILQLVNTAKMTRRGDEYFGSHPVHGSETGHNFWINYVENTWYCFRCYTGGGALSLLAVLEGIIECSECEPGKFRGDDFKKALAIARERGHIKKPAPPKLQVLTDTEHPTNATGLTEATKPDEAAEAILQTFSILTLEDTDEILVYRDGVYRTGGEGLVARTLEDNFHSAALDHISNNHFHSEVLGHLRRRTYCARNEFDKDPHVLNLKNGILDLRTFELRPHSPEYLSVNQLPVKYDPNADCPRNKKFLGEVIYREDEASLQEFCGVTLWKKSFQIALLLVGEGDNGKSTFLRVLAALHGPENVSAVSLQELENDRFAKADLYGKNVNIYPDLPDIALRSTGQFKMLTGGDPVRAQRKHQQAFTFGPYVKLIYSCNKIPAVPEDTIAFFRRWHIVTFPNVFLGKEDKDLLNKLTTEDELSGFLNWCIEGLKRLKDNGWNLSGSKSVEETRQEYVRKSDPIQAFAIDCCTIEAESEISKDTLYENFKKYCQNNKLPAAYKDQFFRKLTKHATLTTIRPRDAGKRVWSIKGLKLKDEKDWGSSEEKEEPEDKSLYELALCEADRLTREKGVANRDDLEAALSGKLTPEQLDRYMKQIVKDGLAEVLDWGKWRTLR